jgi:hypothetical protein
MVAVILALAGCLNPQTRFQTPDEGPEASEVLTVGKVMSSFAHAEGIPVSGVGLVVGLDGTGGEAPPGSFRTLLEDHLRKHGVERVKEVLSSPDASMVLVSAVIPPGVRKDDPVDIEVSLPPQSKTTSLRGGFLKTCFLFNYDTAKKLSPEFEGPNRTFLGHKLVRAEGPLTLGGTGDDAENPCSARVWAGGRSLISRNLWIVMDGKYESAPVVQRVAERINATFHGPSPGAIGGVAVAKTKSYLTLDIPPQYRLNLPRYLRVVRMIPVQEDPPAGSPYRSALEEELLDPAKTITAALRLEALGKSSVPALKQGLQSEETLVRFTSAEALAYLGHPAAGEELARLIEHQPTLRAFCLTAMTALDEPISRVKLRELLDTVEPSVRYGAFRALRALDEHESTVKGELLADSFWLHRTAVGSAPMLHVSTSRRAEVVIFGDDVALVPPFAFRAGDFTITAPRGDTRCTLGRLSAHHGAARRQCRLDVHDVIHNLAELGITYTEVVDLLRQAAKFNCLTCQLAVDALPQATTVEQLAQEADPDQFPKKGVAPTSSAVATAP